MQKFMNGVELNQEHPETFRIPSPADKDSIYQGDFVKVGFLTGDDHVTAERMWLLVTKTKGNKIWGALSNEPEMVECKWGDIFRVHADNVLAIHNDDD